MRLFRLSKHIWLSPQAKKFCWGTCGLMGMHLLLQYQFGTRNDFFRHEFKVRSDPLSLADFYGTEEFMAIYCIFPWVEEYMMRGATFQDDGTVYNPLPYVPGEMVVSMKFRGRSENFETKEDEEDDDEITFFEKKERFVHNFRLFSFLTINLWDQMQNFGFYVCEDGVCECFHHGESFHGPWPVYLIFKIHSYVVAYRTKKYLNSDKFNEDD